MIWFKFRPISFSLLRRLQSFQMGGEASIRRGDELLVEALLAPTGFFASDENDRLSLVIKREGGPPFPIGTFEPQLLHIGVFRTLERIYMRPSQLRPILGQQLGDGDQYWTFQAGIRLNETNERKFSSHTDLHDSTNDASANAKRQVILPSGVIGLTYRAWQSGADETNVFADYRNTFKPAAIDFGPDYTPRVKHRDSESNALEITPGAMNLMTAGRGIAHSERSPLGARRGSEALFGIQSWIALPQAYEETDPTFQHFDAASLPTVEDGGMWARVIAGSTFGRTSPVETLSEWLYAEVSLTAGASEPLDPARRMSLMVAGLWSFRA